MVNRLRIKLASSFTALTMVLYTAGSLATISIFDKTLDRSLNTSLQDLMAEIRPVVRIKQSTPTLENWGVKAKQNDHSLLTSVQLYDKEKKILENYGPNGVNQLANGRIASNKKTTNFSVQSMYEGIKHQNTIAGYIQVQLSTKQKDRAIREITNTSLLIAPFLAIAVALAGYIFAGIAVRPVEKTINMLRNFVSDAGHELNTPIATIEAGLQTLQEPSKSDNFSEEVLVILEKASLRLKQLSANLILLARIEDPDSDEFFQSINASEIAEFSVSEYAEAAELKNVKLTATLIKRAIYIKVNEELFRECLENLIDNAIKYTESEGAVHVSSAIVDEKLEIIVSDTGIGIPIECQKHIFDRFYRVDKSRSRSAGGSGLGLAIVKAGIEKFGGTISFESKEGNGSVFKITLPTINNTGDLEN